MKYLANAYYILSVRSSLFSDRDGVNLEQRSVPLGTVQADTILEALAYAGDIFHAKATKFNRVDIDLSKLEQLSIAVALIKTD